MKALTLIIMVLLCISTKSYSQQLSLRINNLGFTDRTEIVGIDSLNLLPQIQESYRYVNIDFLYSHFHENFITYGRFGVSRFIDKDDKTNLVSNGIDGYILEKYERKVDDFTVGLGILTELISKKRIKIYTGIEIPFSMQTSNFVDFNSAYYDMDNNLQRSSIFSQNYVPLMTIGLGIPIMLNYFVHKNIAITFDINYFYIYSFSNGSIVEVNETYDDLGNTLSSANFSRIEKVNRMRVQQFISIGLKYDIRGNKQL